MSAALTDPLALFVQFVRLNPAIPPDDPMLERVWCAYQPSAPSSGAGPGMTLRPSETAPGVDDEQ